MAMQKAKSGLAKKLGSSGAEAFEAHKNDETKISASGDLPGGIEGGVAQLVDCKFDQYKTGDNQGEYYFYAAGVVVSPKSVTTKDGTIIIKGSRTSIMEPMCDTVSKSGKGRQSVSEHLEWVLNEMRKLGVNTSEIGFDDLETVAESLIEAAPFFRFRTWQGKATEEYPDPRVNHEWKGVVTDYVPDDEEEVKDETEEEKPASKPTAKPTAKAVTAPAKPPAKPTAKPTAKKPEPEPEPEEELDLDALAEAADNDDTEAQSKLAGHAKLYDVDYESAENWTAVAEALKEVMENASAEAENAEEEAEAETEWTPAKTEVYMYKPAGTKKAIECEVMAVFADKKTVNLKNLDDGKTSYKGVKWDALSAG